jgi:hypothetical protein
MAVTKGCGGVIKLGVETLGELREWQMKESVQIHDAPIMGNCLGRSVAGRVSTTLSLQLYWDEDDAGQALVVSGTEVGVELYPGGEGSGLYFWEGTALVADRDLRGSVDGLVEYAVSANVQGAMALSQVA